MTCNVLIGILNFTYLLLAVSSHLFEKCVHCVFVYIRKLRHYVPAALA